MKRLSFCFAFLAVVLPLQMFAQTTKWTCDKAHTSVKFEVQHLGIAIVAGQFMEFDGSMLSDKADFTDAKINCSVQTKSVNTNVEMRDKDLRSDNFFSVEKFPQMTFKGTALEKRSNGKYILTGYLTIKDVTKLVHIGLMYHATIKDPWGKTRTGFRAELTINRFDYHILYGETFGNHVLDIAPEVKIIIDIELIKAE
jgi:polyisoprenoid-binding protein YceI